MTKPLAKVLVTGEDLLLRDSLVKALDSQTELFYLASAAPEDTLRRLRMERWDVLLVDFSHSDCELVSLVRTVCSEPGAAHVLLLGVDESSPELMRCIEAGARGALTFDETLEGLESAILELCRGKVVYPPEVTSSMFTRLAELSLERQKRKKLEALHLTSREMEVLQQMANRLSNKAIAAHLGLSIHTVKNHVHNILEKLQARNRGQAVAIADQRGWFEPWSTIQANASKDSEKI